MKHTMKRVLSCAAVIVMLMTILPFGALAADGDIATVAGQGYASLQEAVNAANGKTITMIDDVVITTPVTIPADTTVTLDLAGCTIAGEYNAKAATRTIDNKGTLTITDSVGGGKITSLAFNPDKDWGGDGQSAFPTYANNAIDNRGTLNVNGGTVENATNYSGATYAIDNYGGTVTVDGGTVIHSAGTAIRQFANSTTTPNNVVIKSGTVEGYYRAVWMQLPSNNASVAPLASLTVSGGTLTSNDAEYNLAVYVYSYGNSAANVKITVSDGFINGNIAINDTACGTIAKGNLSVTGGVFNGKYGIYGYADIADAFISGGKFAVAPDAEYVVSGYNGSVKVGEYYQVHKCDQNETVAGKDATCKEEGLTEGKKCSVCGTVTVQQNPTDKAACTIKSVAAADPTYYSDGCIAHYACTVCGNVYADADGNTPLKKENVIIPMLVQVQDNTASVPSDVVDNAVNNAVQEGTTDVTIDVTVDEMDDNAEVDIPAVTKTELPAVAVEQVAAMDKDATLTVTMTDATVTMDQKTLDTIAKAAANNNTSTIELEVKEIPVEQLNDDQQAAMAEEDVVGVISASIIVNNTEVHDFEGGVVTVTIPFTPKANTKGSDYVVYYVADDGTVQKIPTQYVDGALVLTLNHFSEYVIVNTAPATPATGDSAPMAWMITLFAASAAAVVLLISKKFAVK